MKNILNIEKLRDYESRNLVYSQVHPTLPLIIWNYSVYTQYNSLWDDITLSCRGLVTDFEGNVISKGFSKFFNHSENKTDIPKNIEKLRVYDKLDGSYIGLFHYDGNLVVNSKGSFDSEQSNWAMEILGSKDLSDLKNSYTYCFELIHPENRIVVDYGEETDLILLTAFDNVDNSEVVDVELNDFKKVRNWESEKFSPNVLRSLDIENKEGYVFLFDNGSRLKIKFDEYLRLHKIVTNTTSYDIWECLMENRDFDEILDRVPDEFYDFVTETRDSILEDFSTKFDEINDEFYSIIDKKKYAEKIKENKNKKFLFSRLNSFSKRFEKLIWNSIKPEFKEPFKNIKDDKE